MVEGSKPGVRVPGEQQLSCSPACQGLNAGGLLARKLLDAAKSVIERQRLSRC